MSRKKTAIRAVLALLAIVLLASPACEFDCDEDDDNSDEIACEFWDDRADVRMNDLAAAEDLSGDGVDDYLATLSWNLEPTLFADLLNQSLSDVVLSLRGSITNSGAAEATYSISLSDSRYGEAEPIGSVTVAAGKTYSFASPEDFNEPASEVRAALERFIVDSPHNDWDYAQISLSDADGAIERDSFALAISAGPLFWLHSEGCGWYQDLDLPSGAWIEDAWLSGVIDNLSETDSVAVKLFSVATDYGYASPRLLDQFSIGPQQSMDLADRSASYGSNEVYEIMDLFLYDYDFLAAIVAINESDCLIHDLTANVEVLYPDYDYD